MASKIRVLSDHTINKIAAGEVIENPASVVKELVENSLDAGANDICVEIRGGGRQMIRISDNGCGMNGDDALLCLERHATSKIREVEEIHFLLTMGFRGEAIPSIASISKFMLLTCPKDEVGTTKPAIGTMLMVDGGKILSCSPAVRTPGTTIEVKSLFFNVPVRRKFLKSPAYDANEIHKTLSLMALGHPEIKFQLLIDGKSVLLTHPAHQTAFQERLKERANSILGDDFTENSLTIEAQFDEVKIGGLIGKPGHTRHNRSGQYLFINQRAVVSPLISFAIKEGYGTALVNGRHPVFVLHMSLPGELVDVNVHPQKREVRLRQEQQIKEMVIKSVRKALQPTFTFHAPQASLPEMTLDVQNTFGVAPKPFAPAFDNSTPWTFTPKTTPTTSFTPPPTYALPPHLSNSNLPLQKPVSMTASHEQSLPHMQPPKNTSIRVLGTIARYILIDGQSLEGFKPNLTNGTGIVLIDQRAAHSRIIFEKLLSAQSGAPIGQQHLLIPHTLELPAFEAQTLRQSLTTLQKLGFSIQEFGARSFLIEAIPQIFGNSHLENLIKDLLHQMREYEEHSAEQEKIRQIALAASRAAISRESKLSLEEAQLLVNQLFNCQEPHYCPAGKSTLATLAQDEIVKLFQR